jgi:hypothetical protein
VEWHALRSSWISAAAYDPSVSNVELELLSGEVYVYKNVPRSVFEDLLGADSPGRFVHGVLRGYAHYSKRASVARPTLAPRQAVPAARGAGRYVMQLRSRWELEYRYGPLYDRVKSIFLSLPTDRLAALLMDYEGLYGQGALKYAIRTIPLWRAGYTDMSGQTMTRLLDLVPHHLDQSSKYDLVEALRSATLSKLRKTTISLKVRPDESLGHVVGAAVELIGKQASIELPSDLYEIGSWITDNDAKLLQKMVLQMERDVLLARTADLVLNLALLQRVRRELANAKVVAATFEVPTATIHISIGRPRRNDAARMSTPNQDSDLLRQLARAENDHHFQSGSLSFQEYVLRNMDDYFTPQQQAELNQLAARQGIELNKLKAEILIRGQTSAHDIQGLLKLLDQLKAQGANADINAEYQTPSGKIQIRAKSSRFGCAIIPAALLLGLLSIVIALIVPSLP